ncbi:Uma2 family endonuclease [Nocardia rhizosphaerae]|uniref:Uma2 family endonuclease n=1 Tax=Nocardia rhizosphaerae TaxID=1691571 RepID=A0ABV8L4N2_9NOCA
MHSCTIGHSTRFVSRCTELIPPVPFNLRRPDAIVNRCIESPRDRWKTKPTAADTLLVVEVVSPATVTADCVDKRAEYARLGIEQYWIVRLENNDGRVRSIEILRLNTSGHYVTTETRFRSHDSVAWRSPNDRGLACPR